MNIITKLGWMMCMVAARIPTSINSFALLPHFIHSYAKTIQSRQLSITLANSQSSFAPYYQSGSCSRQLSFHQSRRKAIFCTQIDNLNDPINAQNSTIINNDNKKQEQYEEAINLPTSNVCVLLPTIIDSNTDITPSQFSEYEKVAKEISSNLTLPLLSYQPEEDQYSLHDNGDEEQIFVSIHSYTHCLRIIPYQIPSSLPPSMDNLPKPHSYAISIQPVHDPNDSNTNTRKKRKKTLKKKKTRNFVSSIQPLYIDFAASSQESQMGKRLSSVNKHKGGGEMLLKAVSPSKAGKKRNEGIINDDGTKGDSGGAIVFDVTAGFGQDSALIALGGARKVLMMERDPIVALLLKDALRRLQSLASYYSSKANNADLKVKEDQTHSILWSKEEIAAKNRILELSSKLSLMEGDGVHIMNSIMSKNNQNNECHLPDVCYLDPMFPARTKSAAVKKNMQVLHGLLSTNINENMNNEEIDEARNLSERELLESALNIAQTRVVVKRPISAPTLGNISCQSSNEKSKCQLPKPSFDVRGSVNRWDVYININS